MNNKRPIIGGKYDENVERQRVQRKYKFSTKKRQRQNKDKDKDNDKGRDDKKVKSEGL